MNKQMTAAVTFLFAVVLCTGIYAAGKKNPKIVLPVLEWDFGTIKEGKVYEKKIEVANRGNAPLVIEALIEGCSCLSASISDKKIKPGKKASLVLRYNSKGSSGEIERTVQIMTNDPGKQLVVFTIKGNITE